jgi:CBS domain-containing protein
MPANLKSLATAVVIVVEPDTKVLAAAQLMRRHHVGALVVVDAREKSKPVGILTDRDLVLAVMAEGLDAALFTAGDVMSGNLVTAAPEMDALDAVGLMRTKCLRRLVVVDDAGRLVGIATLEDMLELVAGELSCLAGAVAGARDRELAQRTC